MSWPDDPMPDVTCTHGELHIASPVNHKTALSVLECIENLAATVGGSAAFALIAKCEAAKDENKFTVSEHNNFVLACTLAWAGRGAGGWDEEAFTVASSILNELEPAGGQRMRP